MTTKLDGLLKRELHVLGKPYTLTLSPEGFNPRAEGAAHPNIWHEGVFGLSGTHRFFDQKGAVHARVSVDFAREFGCLLEAPIA